MTWTEDDHRELKNIRVALCDIRDVLMEGYLDKMGTEEPGVPVGVGEPRPATGCEDGDHDWTRVEPAAFGQVPHLSCVLCGHYRPVDDAGATVTTLDTDTGLLERTTTVH